MRIALEEADKKPEGEIFIIPARLEECDNLESLSRWHWVDLFDSDGFQRLILALRVRAEKIGATLRQRRGGQATISRPKLKMGQEAAAKAQLDIEELERQKAAKEKADREAAEKTAREKAEQEAARVNAKARLEAKELARQKTAEEKTEREAAEKAAHEKTEQEAAEKTRLESEELARQKAAREKAERDAAEKARLKVEELARQKAEKEKADHKAAERAAREKTACKKALLEAEELAKQKAAREIAEKEAAEKDAQKRTELAVQTKKIKHLGDSKSEFAPLFWVGGIFGIFIIAIILSTINKLSPTAASFIVATRTPLPKALVSDSLTNTPEAQILPTQPALSKKNSTPTVYVGSLPTEIKDTKGVQMMLVPSGNFMMGRENGNKDEKSVHQVYLDDFYMDKYEVTNALYKVCEDAGGCTPPQQTRSNIHSSYYGNSEFVNYPVIYVDWNQADSYCKWRGSSTSSGQTHLPTEAQWEKAARGTDGRTYPWGNDPPNKNLLNYNEYVGDTTAVGNYESGKSPYGIYDLAGNVWEWVNDWYDGSYYQSSPSTNPLGPDSGTFRVLRGGSWFDNVFRVRAADRLNDSPGNFDYYVGFRCARNAKP